MLPMSNSAILRCSGVVSTKLSCCSRCCCKDSCCAIESKKCCRCSSTCAERGLKVLVWLKYSRHSSSSLVSASNSCLKSCSSVRSAATGAASSLLPSTSTRGSSFDISSSNGFCASSSCTNWFSSSEPTCSKCKLCCSCGAKICCNDSRWT